MTDTALKEKMEERQMCEEAPGVFVITILILIFILTILIIRMMIFIVTMFIITMFIIIYNVMTILTTVILDMKL